MLCAYPVSGALKNNKVYIGMNNKGAHQLGEVGHHHGQFKPIHTGLNGIGFSGSSYGQPSGSLVGQVLLNPQVHFYLPVCLILLP